MLAGHFVATNFVKILNVFQMSIFKPDLVPYNYLGPFGRLTLFLVKNYPDILKGTWVQQNWLGVISRTAFLL